MNQKIIVVNAGPRKGWNTDTLLKEAAKGAESVGAEVEQFDLFHLERYTGCISCVFQSLTYNRETPSCNQNPIPVLLIMTSNAPDTAYLELLNSYRQTLDRFVGPTELLVSGDTLQLKDYSKTDWEWSIFQPEAKLKRHETVFPEECRAVFEKGAALVRRSL